MGDDLTEDDETELSFNEGDVNSNVNNDDSETITVIVDGDISHRSNSKPKTNTCPNAPDNDTDSQDSRAGDECSLCLEVKINRGNAVCTLDPCKHEFHTSCMYTYFEKCFSKGCPLCRRNIVSLVKGGGERVAATELRAMYRQRCYDISFYANGRNSNAFSYLGETIDVDADVVVDEAGNAKFTCQVPTVKIQLLNSDHLPQTAHTDIIIVTIATNGEGIFPDASMMVDGVAVFDNIRLDASFPGLVTLKFMVTAPGLNVHRKSLFAGVNIVQRPFWRFTVFEISCFIGLLIVVVLTTLSIISFTTGM